MLKIEKTIVDLKKTVGKNYKEFWDFKGRYRVVKGGRGSKKSTTAALRYIYHLLKHKNANLLCVRQFYNSLKDSQFSELKKACERLKVTHLWLEAHLEPVSSVTLPFQTSICQSSFLAKCLQTYTRKRDMNRSC